MKEYMQSLVAAHKAMSSEQQSSKKYSDGVAKLKSAIDLLMQSPEIQEALLVDNEDQVPAA